MADRFFPNEMPNFVVESAVSTGTAGGDSLTNLLSLPYKSLSDHLKSAALALKETVFSLQNSVFGLFNYHLLASFHA